MWPLRRRKQKERSGIAKKVIVGLVIGGAISSIIGKKLLEKKEQEHEDEDAKGR